MKKHVAIIFLIFSTSCFELTSNTSCISDSDCISLLNQKYFCQNSTCTHDSIFPTSIDELLGLLAIVLISMVANLGGIGGGEVIVSVYIYFFEYSIREAIPLSKVTILAGSLVNFLVNYDRRHDLNKNSFLIDYKLVSLVIPSMLAGTTIGVAFTKSFPSAIILMLVVALVINFTIKMTIKARQLQTLENLTHKNADCNSEIRSFKNDLFLLFDKIKRPFIKPKFFENSQPTISSPEIFVQKDFFDEIKDEEAKFIQRRNKKTFSELIQKDLTSVFIIFSSLLTILISTFVRTRHTQNSSTCSSSALLIFLSAQYVCFLLARIAYRQNIEILHNLTIGTIEGNKQFFRWIILNSYLAGILAGTLGMGGGIIINPMLINLGISPEISTAASNVVVFFTSLSTSSQFFMLGGISLSNVFLVLILSGFGAFLAAVYLDEIIRAYKRPSILVWILAIMLMISSVTIPVVGKIRMSEELNPFLFSSPC